MPSNYVIYDVQEIEHSDETHRHLSRKNASFVRITKKFSRDSTKSIILNVRNYKRDNMECSMIQCVPGHSHISLEHLFRCTRDKFNE